MKSRHVANTVSSWLVLGTTIIVSLVLTPVIIRSLGMDQFGVWRVLMSVVGYYGVIDMALLAAVMRYLARYRDDSDKTSFREVLSTALLLGLAFDATLIFLALVVWPLIGPWLVPAPDEMASTTTIVRILAVTVSFSTIGAIFSSVPYAFERLYVRSFVTFCSEVLRGILSFGILRTGGGIFELVLLTLGLSMATCLAHFLVVRWSYSDRLPSFRQVKRATAAELVRFGIPSSITKIADVLRFQIDLLITARFLGASAAGVYAIALMLIRMYQQFVGTLAEVTQPRLAAIAADHSRFSTLLLLYSNVVSTAAMAVAGTAFVLCDDFLKLWLHEEPESIGRATIIFRILLVAATLNVSSRVGILGLRAINRHAAYARHSVLEGVANLVLSLILIRPFGLIGVALGTVIPTLIWRLLIQPHYTCRLIRLNLREYYWDAFLRPAIPAAIILAATALLSLEELTSPDSYIRFALLAVAVSGGFCAGGVLIALKHEARTYLSRLFQYRNDHEQRRTASRI